LPIGTVSSRTVRVFGHMLYLDPAGVPQDDPTNITLEIIAEAPFVLQPGVVYYNNLRAWNGALLYSETSSMPFMVRRPQDRVIDAGFQGEVAVVPSVAVARRAINLTGSAMFLELSTDAVPNGTLLSVLPLSQNDLATTYTYGTGTQVDVFSRAQYSINATSYLSDPTVAPPMRRRALTFVGLSLGVVPSGVNGSVAQHIAPIIVGGTLGLSWNASVSKPAWMYWDHPRGRWETVASSCGTTQDDTVSVGAGGSINVTARVR
jgi:hypothetical protein